MPKRRSRAKRVSNDRSLFPFSLLFLSIFCFSFFSLFFFLFIPRDDGIYRARFSHVALGLSLIMNGLFIVADHLSRVRPVLSTLSPYVPVTVLVHSRPHHTAGLPFSAVKKRNALWFIVCSGDVLSVVIVMCIDKFI